MPKLGKRGAPARGTKRARQAAEGTWTGGSGARRRRVGLAGAVQLGHQLSLAFGAVGLEIALGLGRGLVGHGLDRRLPASALFGEEAREGVGARGAAPVGAGDRVATAGPDVIAVAHPSFGYRRAEGGCGQGCCGAKAGSGLHVISPSKDERKMSSART